MARTTKASASKAGKGAKGEQAAGGKTAAKRGGAGKDAGGKTPANKASTTKGSGAKTSGKKDGNKPLFDEKFRESQRLALLAEREKYLRSADTLKAEADALVEAREPGDVQFDDESGEGDTLAVERERDLALSAHARAAVEQIDAALQRLEDGTYGVCVVSGEPIPKERLKAIPWAAERVEHKAGGFGRR